MASPPARTVAAPTRVRRARVVALGGALVLTMVIAGASILLPENGASASASASARPGSLVTSAVLPSVTAAATPPVTPRAAVAAVPKAAAVVAVDPAPPANSGSGRRIVFDQSDQRVWLVEADESVDRTYLVSGSRHDNVKPGTYAVQSRQREAVAFDYTGTMEYFVRFATGRNAPIGFHSIPVYNNGEPEQTVDELGTALSAGCVRQKKSDAKYLWDWAPDGTTVVVTA